MQVSKSVRIILLIIILFVTGVCVFCLVSGRTSASYERHVAEVAKMYQTSTYENDPNYCGLISGVRTGGRRDISNLSAGEYEYTDDGMYITSTNMMAFGNVNEYPSSISGSFAFYVDHSSDHVIKLCGRADCRHDTDQCNAFLRDACSITYYDGHLYYATVDLAGGSLAELYRMDMDGSNHVKILDCATLRKNQYDSFWDPRFINGVFMVGMSHIDKETGMPLTDWYYCKLDNNRPKIEKSVAGYCWTDGESFLHGSFEKDTNGVSNAWSLMKWDPDTNTEVVLNVVSNVDDVDKIVYNTYWGTECGMRYEDGKIVKISYPDTTMEVLFETGLSENAVGDFYPDCIAVFEKGNYLEDVSSVLHFFDYHGNKLGQVLIDIPVNSDMLPIVGETRNRIYIRGNNLFTLPTHYIDKSEFNSEELKLHLLDYPDLKEYERDFLFSDWGAEAYIEYSNIYDSQNYQTIN